MIYLIQSLGCVGISFIFIDDFFCTAYLDIKFKGLIKLAALHINPLRVVCSHAHLFGVPLYLDLCFFSKIKNINYILVKEYRLAELRGV